MDTRNERAPGERGAEELRTLPDYTADHTTRPFPIHYSRGRDKYDAHPEQRSAVSFDAFAEAVLSDRSKAKGLTWISGPFAQNGNGRPHRCQEGALPRRFVAFDLDGATPDAFADLCMMLGEYSGFGYTTTSHTAESPHARYILELSRAVDRTEGIRLGEAMQQRIEARLGLGVVKLDRSVYRAEQPIFAPLIEAETMSYHGDPVEVDQILKDAPPLGERPGRAERAAAIASRDPVVRMLADRGMIKRDHGDGKLSTACPCEGEHTGPGGESATAYFLPNFGGVPYGKFVCMHRHCDGRQQEDYLRALGLEPKEVWREQGGKRKSRRGTGAGTDAPDGEIEPEKNDGAPFVIKCTPGELPRNLDEAETALLRDEHDRIFQRGSILVRIARIPEPGGIQLVRRYAGALTIVPLDKPYLIERATAAARWEVLNRKTKKWMPANCPGGIAEGLLARVGRWRFPVLAAITECPVLLEDGGVLDTPGYDARTGILFDPGPTKFPPIEKTPSRLQGEAALEVILGLIKDFPFPSETDRSVALSAILTPLCRHAMRSTPLFAVSAPTMGTGKTLLADLVSLIATGRRAAVMSHGADATEERKRLLAVLIEGDPVIVIDNIAEPFGSDAMCAILTAATYKDRLLGANKIVTVPTCVTWLATGNNLMFRGDLGTRVLIARLDARCERPEERIFERDLLAWVPEHRGRLAAAGLTVLRGYITAGRPGLGLTPFGRFEKWSDLVRSALVWLGQADPCKSRDRIEHADSVREALTAVLSAWWARFGKDPQTIAAAIEHGGDDLRAAFMAVAEEKGSINTRRMGRWLKKYEGRIVSGLRFESAGERGGVLLWRVISANGEAGEGV